MFHHSQRCDSCGSIHQWSEVRTALNWIKSSGVKYGYNETAVTHMRDIHYNLPIEVKRPQEQVPFCHKCLRPQMLSHLPNPPKPVDARPTLVAMQIVQKQPTRTRWQDKHGNWHIEDIDPADQPKVKAAKVAKAPKRQYTIDDI